MSLERIRIDRIAAGGDGVGRLGDGRVIFVPRTAPGDLVSATAVRTAARFVRGRIDSVEEAGPDRIEPPCPHYQGDECGGCQLQHLAPQAQRSARRTIVGDAVRRIGKLDVADPDLTPAPAEWGYRSRISLSRGRDGQVGYHRYDRPGQIFQLSRCPIAAEPINGMLERLGGARGLLPRNLERLTLRLDRAGGEHLVLETGEGPVWSGGARLRAAMLGPAPLTIWWRPTGGAARAVAGADSAYPATAFEQVNPAMGDQVRRHAIERLGAVDGRRVWDLYAGIGETAEAVAAAGGRVESVESDLGAVAEAERRQARFGDRIERVAGRAEAVVASLGSPDLVVANPPRAGLAGHVVDVLLERRPERIVYVSCDPATLARDLGRLRAGFRLAGLESFDLFPQTAHVESVAVLERA